MQPIQSPSPNHVYLLHQILNGYTPTDQGLAEILYQNGTVEYAQKDEIIFHERRINTHEYFQLEGVSHRFNSIDKRRRLTTGIYQDATILTPHFARTLENQSIFSLQALTDCSFLVVSTDTFSRLLDQHEPMRRFAHAVVEKEFKRSMNFEVLFRSSLAKDRLLFFRRHYPKLENIIPHTIIASFLGVTPVSLSRLRGELG